MVPRRQMSNNMLPTPQIVNKTVPPLLYEEVKSKIGWPNTQPASSLI